MMSSDLDVPAAGQRYRPGLGAPAVARRFARNFLADVGASQKSQEVAELLVSELVTNAVVYARSTVRLSLSVSDGTGRIEVGDDGPGLPMPREPAPDQGGYGLWLTDRLARSWGIVAKNGGGKAVWFTVPVPDEQAAPEQATNNPHNRSL
jgi:anti-sigma regulatory factor (Ser/Thr protein kinase)